MINFRKDELQGEFNYLIKQGIKFDISIYKKFLVKVRNMEIIFTKGKNNYDYTAYIQDGGNDADLAQIYFNFENISAINCSPDGKFNYIELNFE